MVPVANHEQRVVIRKCDRRLLLRLHEPDMAVGIQTAVQPTAETPYPVPSKPLSKMRFEPATHSPGQDAAWLEDAAALVVDSLVVFPILFRLAKARLWSPVVNVGFTFLLSHHV